MYVRYYIWEKFKNGDRDVRQLGRMDGYTSLEEARADVRMMQHSYEVTPGMTQRRFLIAKAEPVEGTASAGDELYDSARDLAVKHGRNTASMAEDLCEMGATPSEICAVMDAQVSSDYQETYYRGAMCDEGVIEALKDFLRRFDP